MCMAVVAVPTGIVSRKFPEFGKSTGKNSNSRPLATALPNVTAHIHKDFHQNRHPEMKLTAKYQGIRINSDYAQLTDFRPVSPTLVTLCSLMVNASTQHCQRQGPGKSPRQVVRSVHCAACARKSRPGLPYPGDRPAHAARLSEV